MAGSVASNVVPTYVQPRIVLRHAHGGKTATFLGVSTAEGIFAVASREIDLAIINPATVLSVALRGKGIFKQPMPVRAIAVIPSWDQFVFAVRPETGLSCFEDIARRKPKLRILMRGAPDHTLHHMFDDVAAAAGFSRDDIGNWGGEVRKAGSGTLAAYRNLQGAHLGRRRRHLRRSGDCLGAASARGRDHYLAARRSDRRNARGDGLSPRHPADVDLS